jgi:hypothetical protein
MEVVKKPQCKPLTVNGMQARLFGVWKSRLVQVDPGIKVAYMAL